MDKNKPLFGKAWTIFALIGVILSFAANAVALFTLINAMILEGFSVEALLKPTFLVFGVGTLLSFAGIVGYLVGMASGERSTKLIAMLESLLGALAVPAYQWVSLAFAESGVLSLYLGFAEGVLPFTLLQGSLYFALAGFLLLLILHLVYFKKGKGTLVLRILGFVFLVGAAACVVVGTLLKNGFDFMALFSTLFDIGVLVSLVSLLLFGVAALFVLKVREEPAPVDNGEKGIPERENDGGTAFIEEKQ